MPISAQTDSELFEALKAGNRHALGILYDRYGVLVYRLALRILGNTQDAEDLTQDVFISLSRSTAFDANRGTMQAFLMVMTRSRSIDRIRKLRSQAASLQKWNQALAHVSSESPMEKASNHEVSEQVRAALKDLPEKHRQVLEMAYYEGRSQSEIAQDLGIPLGTIKSWARQGLISLRKVLKNGVAER